MEGTQICLMRPRHDQDGLTVYQLLVAIVVLVICAALWGAYNKHQQLKEQQHSSVSELHHG